MMALVFVVILASICGGVDVVGLRVDVDEDRLGAGAGDGAGGGEEGVGRGDHFVARPDVLGHQADQQGVAAGGDGDGVRAAAVRGQLGLALGHGRAEDALLALQHGVDGRADFVADRGVLGLQVEQRNGDGLRHVRGLVMRDD